MKLDKIDKRDRITVGHMVFTRVSGRAAWRSGKFLIWQDANGRWVINISDRDVAMTTGPYTSIGRAVNGLVRALDKSRSRHLDCVRALDAVIEVIGIYTSSARDQIGRGRYLDRNARRSR